MTGQPTSRARRLIGAVFACLLLAGCSTQGPERIDFFPPEPITIWMGGVHPVWTDEGVTFEGYAINTQATPYEGEYLWLRGLIFPHDDPRTRISYEHDETPVWAPNETRQVAATYHDINPAALAHLMILEAAGLDFEYYTKCFTPSLEPADICGISDTAYAWVESDTDRESEDYEYLLKCCQWLPPPFDTTRVDCRLVETDIVCDFTVLNYRREAYGGTLALVLTEVNAVTGESTELARQEVHFGGPIEGRTTRDYHAVIPNASHLLDQRNPLQYEMTVVAGRIDLPRSTSTETTRVVIINQLPPPPAQPN